jgi:acetoacetyl-CoA synthetase
MRERAEILWTPGPDELEYSRIAEYLRWLSTERNLHFTDYHALQRWSVDDLPAFWRTVWDYFSVIAQSEPVDILPNRITFTRKAVACWLECRIRMSSPDLT